METTERLGIGNVTDHRLRRMSNGEHGIKTNMFLSFLSIDLGAAILAPSCETPDLWSVSAISSFLLQDIPRIHAFSRFGRCLNAVRCLIFKSIFAHISQCFRLRRTTHALETRQMAPSNRHRRLQPCWVSNVPAAVGVGASLHGLSPAH